MGFDLNQSVGGIVDNASNDLLGELDLGFGLAGNSSDNDLGFGSADDIDFQEE